MYGTQWLAVLHSPEKIREEGVQGGGGGMDTSGLWSFLFLEGRKGKDIC